MKKSSHLLNMLILAVLTLFVSCSQSNLEKSELYPLQLTIVIPEPTDEQRKEFNSDIESEFITVEKENSKQISGFRSKNKQFLEKIITPIVSPYLKQLAEKSPTEIINTLTLFGYELYQIYFGRDFYRWGGDILDLDDPQNRSHRYKFSYGLDCSGFASLPYELAVYFGLLTEDNAVFSSRGYRQYCERNQITDVGGREETSNNYRLDTRELANLGDEVFTLEKNQIPIQEQINLLQPGDIVGRSGHFGIIAELKGEPYYLESGGWVVPKNNGIPVKAIEALRIFASSGAITVRRCLK